MSCLEQAKKQLTEYEEKQKSLFREIKETYDEDDFYERESDIESGIYGGDIILEWYEYRDVDYIGDIVSCQELLVRALEFFEQKDKKSLHHANKAFETLVHEARRIKKARTEDIQQAQNVIDAMNEIIRVCDENRK